MGRGWAAPPIQERDLHETPLPRLGGVPIFLSFLISITIAFLAGLHFPALAVGPSIRTLLTILLPGTLIFLLGLYDDIRVRTQSLRFKQLLPSCCLLAV